MELMLCFAVLAILTAVGIPVYRVALKNKREDECLNNRRIVQNIMLNYQSGLMFESGPQVVPRVVITSNEEDGKEGTVTTVDYSNIVEPIEKYKLTVPRLKAQFVLVPGCPEGGTFTVAAGSSDCWPTCSKHTDS